VKGNQRLEATESRISPTEKEGNLNMKSLPRSTRSARCLLGRAALLTLLAVPHAPAGGIPEPGLILYGVVQDQNSNARLTVGTLEWTIQQSVQGNPVGTPVVVSGVLSNINDQFSYVLHIPCELPLPGETLSPNTLSMTAAP
jgi:hypothetical protein